jgi:alkylhydroperoxidase family enzyme
MTMPLIETVTPEKASGKVAAVYGDIRKIFGRVPNGMQMYSPSPTLLAQQWESMGYYLKHPALSFPLLAAIRMLVSQENDCHYCIGMNAGLLIQMGGWTVEQVAATKQDPEAAPLPEKEKALLAFVLKTVAERKAVTRAEIVQLKKLGWNEADILDAVAHGARNVAVDIVFNTFQIENDF